MGWKKGKKHSPETIAKIRAAKLGKKHSPETIAKMRGKKHSPETIAKMRAAKLGWLPAGCEEMYATLCRKIGLADAKRAVLDHVARRAA